MSNINTYTGQLVIIPVLERFVAITLEYSYAPIVTMINMISGRVPIPVSLEKTINETILFRLLRYWYRHDFKFFVIENQVYASTVGIKREFGFYVIAVKTMVAIIISLMIFICFLQKLIPHLKILYSILLQISQLKYVNFAI